MKLLSLILMLAGCAAAPVVPPPTSTPPMRITLDSFQSSVQPEVVSLRLVNTGGANWAVVYPPTMDPSRFDWKVRAARDLGGPWSEEPGETDGDSTLVHTNGRAALFLMLVGEPR